MQDGDFSEWNGQRQTQLLPRRFEYRHRQAHPNPLLKENFFSISLGINFNELWFFQNKIK